jgi:hypothetical protein
MESDLADRLGEFDEVDRLAHVAVWFRVDIRGPQMSIKRFKYHTAADP